MGAWSGKVLILSDKMSKSQSTRVSEPRLGTSLGIAPVGHTEDSLDAAFLMKDSGGGTLRLNGLEYVESGSKIKFF